MSRRHLCILLTGPAVAEIERWRRRWDPVMARLVPAHVTISYPEEVIGEEELLLRRAEACCAHQPFSLLVGSVFAMDRGQGGVFVAVEDSDGGWAELRGELLQPPLRPIDFPPHVTIAHPRTSNGAGSDCFAELADRYVGGELTVREFVFTETTSTSFTVLHSFRLDGRPLSA